MKEFFCSNENTGRGRFERIGNFYGSSGGVGKNTGHSDLIHGGGCD